ncbi:hypothetical protein [Intestinibacillus massiliensis]|uniref:hypothetical protein n=1 Tax=Intestinibacillus massiliensis TaxID=1871029 RepID=UPI00117A4600|nr:hypothetical protein [Intestinibacillus massiliensis]
MIISEKLPEADPSQYRAQILNCLLPDYLDLPKDTRPVEQRDTFTTHDAQDIFKFVLKKILIPDNFNRYLRVEAHGLFDQEYPDKSDYKYWGYIKTYQDKQSKTSFCALLFREDEFIDLIKTHLEECDPKQIIKDVKKEKPAYLHPTGKARMPVHKADQSTVNAIILKIDKLDFIEEDMRNALITGEAPDSEIPIDGSQHQ